MNVFIAWSGDKSLQVAQALRQWLPTALQAVKPFLSDEDIGKGVKWQGAINDHLEQCRFGILCVTADNLDSKWIHFEAGALSKVQSQDRVSALLIGVTPSQLVGPMAQFQNTTTSAEDVLKLVKSINSQLPDPVPIDALEMTYQAVWPHLEEKITAALAQEAAEKPSEAELRTERSMIEEVLELLREQARRQALSEMASQVFSAPSTLRQADTNVARANVYRRMRTVFEGKLLGIRKDPGGAPSYLAVLAEMPTDDELMALESIEQEYAVDIKYGISAIGSTGSKRIANDEE